MKNIHLLPTEKPSRLFKTNSDKLVFDKVNPPIICKTAQHIYITSDEEIKEGDWFICGSEILKCTKAYSLTSTSYVKCKKGDCSVEICKKIILTTDEQLIKDGIQPIDDEFLEWFVKNPSCESVDVKKQYITPLGDVVDFCYDNERLNYKIIIPQEEPKQETVDEAAIRKFKELEEGTWLSTFKRGAKWQSERMYSEEDMKDYALKCVSTYLFNGDFISDNLRIPIVENNNKQFEQFKKK
jgi:hypothetical protein